MALSIAVIIPLVLMCCLLAGGAIAFGKIMTTPEPQPSAYYMYSSNYETVPDRSMSVVTTPERVYVPPGDVERGYGASGGGAGGAGGAGGHGEMGRRENGGEDKRGRREMGYDEGPGGGSGLRGTGMGMGMGMAGERERVGRGEKAEYAPPGERDVQGAEVGGGMQGYDGLPAQGGRDMVMQSGQRQMVQT